jgi:hypothetical protein
MTPARNNRNLFVFLGLTGSLLLLGWFAAVTLASDHWGEQAAALGAFIGGLVGAVGAITAVFLALARQRKEDTTNVTSAVQTEVTGLAKYVEGALDVCADIANGTRHIPRANATYIVKNLLSAHPVIYPAVADRVGLLPHPEATVAFYMRISEAKAMAEMYAAATGTHQPYVTNELAASIADCLITALQLAIPIIKPYHPSASAELKQGVQSIVSDQIEEALARAKVTFPNASSFQAK